MQYSHKSNRPFLFTPIIGMFNFYIVLTARNYEAVINKFFSPGNCNQGNYLPYGLVFFQQRVNRIYYPPYRHKILRFIGYGTLFRRAVVENNEPSDYFPVLIDKFLVNNCSCMHCRVVPVRYDTDAGIFYLPIDILWKISMRVAETYL